ncbi:MAG: M48 family metalloprotease [Proteobacteria bacterium]|nr:M48 family metalloprotease [Pseudomonadota bacterium]
MSKCASRLLLSVLSGLCLTCAVNPVSGKREVILMSEEKERVLGEEAAEQIEREIGLVSDEEIRRYVRTLGEELANYSPRKGVEYRFHVVDMIEPNAFALPGGQIYISRGLLALANSEAEVANVIGHEIAHVAGRHAAQRDSQAKTAGLLALLGAVAAAAAGAPDVAAATAQLGPVAVAQLIAAYGRDQEREADRVGQEMSAEAGIDPAGMALFLRSLDATTRLRLGASRLPSFFDSHPATPERVAESATRAGVLRWEPGFAVARDREAFLRRIDGLVVGPAAAEGVVRESRFLHADLDFSLRFPTGWQVVNQKSRVLALAPQRDGIATLELQGRGDDPRRAGERYAREQRVQLDATQELQIGRLPAFRARTTIREGTGLAAAELTWIAYGGQIYRLGAAAPALRFRRYEGVFRSFARSFRALAPDERGRIDELRLRLVRARAGESLGDLAERTGNEWNPNETAVFNGLQIGSALTEGQLIKIARREPYHASRPTTGDTAASQDDPEFPRGNPVDSGVDREQSG